MIAQGQYTLDEDKRNLFYRRAEEMIIADAPWVFLWHRTDFSIRQPWVKNYKIYPIYSMDKGTEISF
jgi:peptide/nickel transport system substrate-binding protein/oligopeptide transport system substrate-binding protein